MSTDAFVAVRLNGKASPAELRAATTTWSITFDVPSHPGLGNGANLFRHYAGLDVQVRPSKNQPGAMSVAATGTAVELQRVVDWYDQLVARRDQPSLRQAFATEEFMRPAIPQAKPQTVRGLD